MSEQTSMEYYRGRALRERELARISANGKVARIHLEMAEQYEKMIWKNAGSDRRIDVGLMEIKTPAVGLGGR